MTTPKEQAKKCLFYATAGPNDEQVILDRIVECQSAYLVHVSVTPFYDTTGEHHRAPRDAAAAAPRRYFTDVDCANDVDPTVGGQYIVGGDEPDDQDQEANSNYEYSVHLQYRDKPQHYPRWTIAVLNGGAQPLVSACTNGVAINDEDVVTLMLQPRCAQWRTPTLSQKATLLLLRSRFTTEVEVEVRACIDVHYNPHNKTVSSVDTLLTQWRKDVGLRPKLTRLQREHCSPPLRLGTNDLQFIQPYKVEWEDFEENLLQGTFSAPSGGLPLRVNSLTLIGPGGRGKTNRFRSLLPHIYMKNSLNLPLIHDCISDGVAKVIIIDDVPWDKLLQSQAGASIVTMGSFTWTHGGRSVTTNQTLPVIILNNVLPGRSDKCWKPRGWEYWKTELSIVTLDSRLLYAPLAVTTMDSAKGALKGPGNGAKRKPDECDENDDRQSNVQKLT